MEIIGRGMIATALRRLPELPDGAVVYASGVADSGCTDTEKYAADRKHVKRVARWCADDGSRVVFMSSAGHIDRDTPYGQHKRRCEALIRNSGASYLVCRLSNVMGFTCNTSQLVPNLVGQVLSGEVHSQSHAGRDLLDVRALAAIVWRLLRSPALAYQETLTVASGVSVAVPYLIGVLALELRPGAIIHHDGAGEWQHFDIAPLLAIDPHLADILQCSRGGRGIQAVRHYAPQLANLWRSRSVDCGFSIS